ncbi:WcbI family polysaccharide biosynthesis putative acetyltransferase [Herbiconiux solani]|uniref:WcbI family polysaccharide biosynthesis putative acetyltransferase n=1 Tax=Herbiconiux solani TaxID=661329 RepID=UPI000824AD7B|nr:WcbI family polysaccharide biosynthesis putative acetyltransferase [Herbiconiux solani]
MPSASAATRDSALRVSDSPASVPPHLRAFHLPPEQTADPDAIVILTVGNCQAESLRIFLPETTAQTAGANEGTTPSGATDATGTSTTSTSETGTAGTTADASRPLTTVRIPPVHELTAADLAPLRAWLARADHVVLQPIRDGYRGLPIGTRELLAETRPGTGSAIVPVIRFAGLYPRHLIIRPPSDTSLVPPLVAYHDAAILAKAAGIALPPLTTRAIRAVAEASLAELREREQRHGAVVVSDLFASPGFALMRTINHPGNPIWAELARRVLDTLGIAADVRDPGREILGSVHAPREAAVIEAFGLDEAPRAEWIVDGQSLSTDAVRAAHLAWYAEHPDAVQAGLVRHASTLRELAAA